MSLLVACTGWLLSAALALVVARARAAERRRGDRLAAVVHELRGPLHAAGLILVSARRRAGTGAAPALTALEVELGRLRLAVGDLEPGNAATPASAPGGGGCDLTALLGELAPGWSAQAAAAGRTVQVEPEAGAPSLPVAIDRLRLAQALGNLVGNALEHGAGDVVVRAEGTGGDAVLCEVLDAGPGLPAAVATLIARAPDPRRSRGRGLGIAAAIARDAGGALRSAPAARGTRLVLELPAPATHAVAS